MVVVVADDPVGRKSNAPPRMDVPGIDSSAIWRGTSRLAPNPMGHTGPGAKPYCTHDTNTDKGGHTPPKDQTSDGPVPQEVQQLCQLVGHSHVVGKTID